MLIKDSYISLRDNFKEKTTNPFLGTYIIVWFISNWELVYSLINFSSKDSLQFKVSFIKQYYKCNPFFENIFCNILWTLLVLICTYFLLNISRVIVNASEEILKPIVYKYTSKGKIVLRSKFKKMEDNRDYVQKRLDEERKSKAILEEIIKNHEDTIKRLEDTDENNLKDQENNTSSFVNEEDKYEIIYKTLNDIFDDNYIKIFKSTAVMIRKKKPFPKNDKVIDKFIELNLVGFKNTTASNEDMLMLTDDGNNFLNYLNHYK
jgi:hypothetical protein